MNGGSLKKALRGVAFGLLVVGFSSMRLSAETQFQETDLVSDIPGRAAFTDPNLINPWGIAASATSPFWVAANGTGLSTLYNSVGTPQNLVVTIPPPAGAQAPSAPTGVIFNGSGFFEVFPGQPARFVFATEDGTISGWNQAANPTTAILKVDNSASGAVYKGLASGNNGVGNFLYAANFSANRIDVFDGNFAQTTLAGNFTDPTLPSGYAPFNIQNLNGKLYVTYAKQDASAKDDVAGPGNGFVSVFDLDGNLQTRLVSGGALNSPWGLALAPPSFTGFNGSLLVGNFGDGTINAYDLPTGNPLGALTDTGGNPVSIEGLWGLKVGNGGNGGDPSSLYFTAGIAGSDELEDHGLFGSLTPVAAPSTVPDASSSFWLTAGAFLGFIGLRRRVGGPTLGLEP